MVYPCECNNVLQQFKCDPSVAPRTKLNGMCMATMDKDDHVILTGNCSTSNTNLIDRQYIYPEFLLPLITAYPNFDTKIQAGERWVANVAPPGDFFVLSVLFNKAMATSESSRQKVQLIAKTNWELISSAVVSV